jgi:hypothetical protein
VRSDLLLDFGDASERIVPARFQLRRHEAVGGVDGIVLTEGSVGSVARCLKITRKSVADLIAPICHLTLGRNSCSDRSRCNDLEQRSFDSVIDP